MAKLEELPKTYNPQQAEARIYKLWEKSGFFNPDNLPKAFKEPFSIILPPPNVTGTLHMGHAAMLAFEDVLIRWQRMKGFRTLWLPGTDHAAIATQSKVENMLYKEKKQTRHDLGRTEFLKLVGEFAQESHDTIVNQIRRMGSSLDWSREAFTLDEKRNLAVNTAFQRMYEGGLIYRGDRIVNWDPRMQTTVSDDEIEWKEEKTPFYYLRYGPFTIGTARPETKFGDKYVVMHPKDKRYAQYKHGDIIPLEWINGKITATVIKDEAVDMEFGSGVMTITPFHDRTDFEIAERHHLEKERIIDLKGKLLPIAGEFAGTYITKARPQIIEKLRNKDLLERVDENYVHRLATNSRGGNVIEPQIMRQWFVAVNKEFPFPHAGLKGIKKGQKTTIKRLMLHVVKTKQVEILPKRFEKVYFHWVNNLRDWCISRQIWYGHRIPVWYRGEKLSCGAQQPKGKGWEQDQDTLDTWFSSGLWTLSTLGWPKETKDLKTFHPTSVLETGYDILFFWVARMILMTTYLLGEVPFKTVYLHGLVRDSQGRKMSKSLGNVINPLDMVNAYGADATRLSLLIGTAPGQDISLSEDRVRGYRNFVNKIWNIGRFTLLKTEDFKPLKTPPPLGTEEKRILKEFHRTAEQATRSLERFQFSHAAEIMYHYLWHTFADKVIEQSKPVLQDPKKKKARQYVLVQVLADSLKILHPFAPFVTEELYQKLPLLNKKKTLMIERWPV
ncbi:valine--tRNA ligase [Patescibacteria group bacterium]|nr:valine--tRNA ligase [Patescibacteria group bacterium]